jgi:hypothetical protein
VLCRGFVAGLVITMAGAAWAVAEGVGSMAVTLQQNNDVLEMRSGEHILPVSLRSPTVAFTDGQSVEPVSPAEVSGTLDSGGLTAAYDPIPVGEGATLEIELRLTWAPEEQVMRKWARMRVEGNSKPRVIADVTLDRFAAPGARFLGNPPQSYPVFIDGFFVGVEFPIATTRVEGDEVIVSHAPGVETMPGTWYESRRSVYGTAEPGQEIETFKRYIARRRPAAHHLHVNYNSWWTSSVPFTEAEILGLIKTFDEHLYKKHGVALDTFAIDMGWSNPKSIWEIDRQSFPEGFSSIQAAAEAMGSELGLWISPSCFYGPALDTQWAREEGYETLEIPWGKATTRLCCLGGPKYSGAFRDRLVDMITKYNIRHVKLDGYYLSCHEADHGHQPGPLSSEAIAEGGIAAFEAVREAAPDVWFEATCFGWNPSPWWLFYVNSVIGTFGDDSPHGRVPAPIYWESKTTARDYFNLQGSSLLPIPDAAQEVLGLIVQTDDPWMNEGVVVAARGHMFMPLYINPKFMNEQRWAQLAGLIKWTRANADVLAHHTEPLLPKSWQQGKQPRFSNDEMMPREPYGYAHWKDGRGLVMLRNPWIEQAAYTIALHGGDGQPLEAVSLYPEVRVYGRDLPAQSSLAVDLAPYETLVLSIAPAQEAPDIPEAAAPDAELIEVGSARQEMARYAFEPTETTFGPDWTNLAPGKAGEVHIEWAGRVATRAPQTQLLVLLEADASITEPESSLTVDGRPVDLEAGPSEAGWAASSIPAGTEHWLFLRGNLAAGAHQVDLALDAPGDVTSLSVWAWAWKAGTGTPDYPNALPSPEIISLAAVPLMSPTRLDGMETVERRPAKIERIDGVYLDALEPESAVQGWGMLERNQSVTQHPMTIGGKRYRRGLGTHAVSRLVYKLDKRYAAFEAEAGLDGGCTGTATFSVLVDGEKRWESGVMGAQGPAQHVSVNVVNAETLELRVGDAGDGIAADHANWANARLLARH